jgi:hypothetical protein
MHEDHIAKRGWVDEQGELGGIKHFGTPHTGPSNADRNADATVVGGYYVDSATAHVDRHLGKRQTSPTKKMMPCNEGESERRSHARCRSHSKENIWVGIGRNIYFIGKQLGKREITAAGGAYGELSAEKL